VFCYVIRSNIRDLEYIEKELKPKEGEDEEIYYGFM